MTALDREAIVREAETWLGTPFHHATEIKGVGVDCAHLLIGVYCTLGFIQRPEVERYDPNWFQHESIDRLLLLVAQHCWRVDVPAPGDILLYRFGRVPSHAAIVVSCDPLVVIHAFRGRGVITEEAGPGTPLASRAESAWSLRSLAGR